MVATRRSQHDGRNTWSQRSGLNTWSQHMVATRWSQQWSRHTGRNTWSQARVETHRSQHMVASRGRNTSVATQDWTTYIHRYFSCIRGLSFITALKSSQHMFAMRWSQQWSRHTGRNTWSQAVATTHRSQHRARCLPSPPRLRARPAVYQMFIKMHIRC